MIDQDVREKGILPALYPTILEYVSNCQRQVGPIDTEVFRLIRDYQSTMCQIINRLETIGVLNPKCGISKRYDFILRRADTLLLLAMQYQGMARYPVLLDAIKQGILWLMEKETEIMSDILEHAISLFDENYGELFDRVSKIKS